MPGQRQVLLDVLQAAAHDCGDRVFLAIDARVLEGRVDQRELHWHHLGAERAERHLVDLVRKNTDLQAREVGGRADRALGIGDVAKALLAERQQRQPLVGEFGAERRADRALGDRLGVRHVAEHEGNVEHPQSGHDRADHPAGNHRQVDGAGLGRREDGVLTAERAAAALIDDDPLAGQRQQSGAKLVRPELLRRSHLGVEHHRDHLGRSGTRTR